jgi:hypothetical protein
LRTALPGIVHVLAHPVYSVATPLDRVAVEKRLVLFRLWEFVNGSRPASKNRLAREAAESVHALDLRQMALRHGLRVPDHTRIAGTGGSDDHGGIYGGATFTGFLRGGALARLFAYCDVFVFPSLPSGG